jgi:hypothetical protein
MRARNVKPSLFRNELLAVADPLHTIIFAGLWCMADREGRMEDRPAKIHLEINPGRAFDTTTASLAESGFIHRYEIDGKKFIQVVNFAKHQNPHCKEPTSTIPAPCENGTGTVLAGLIPDSGSLIPDSSPSGRVGAAAPSTKTPKQACRIPEDFGLTPERESYALNTLPQVDLGALMEAFRDHWRAKSTADARKADWDATWRTWVRNGLKFGYPKIPFVPKAQQTVVRYDARGRVIQ